MLTRTADSFGLPPRQIPGETRPLAIAAPPDSASEEVQAPVVPYRKDTTGLSTANLPAPPRRNTGSSAPLIPARSTTISSPSQLSITQSGQADTTGRATPPRPPPRLPRRDTNQSDVSIGSSISRATTGGAKPASPALPPRMASEPVPSPIAPQTSNTVSELQNRFRGVAFTAPLTAQPNETSTSSVATSTNTIPATGTAGTTWAQKRAALQTVAAAQKDPSKVSLADYKSTISTADDFRQRHGQQTMAGIQAIDKLTHTDSTVGDAQQPEPEISVAAQPVSIASRKKPPPPPPTKRLGLQSTTLSNASSGPPPVPMASKPK